MRNRRMYLFVFALVLAGLFGAGCAASSRTTLQAEPAGPEVLPGEVEAAFAKAVGEAMHLATQREYDEGLDRLEAFGREYAGGVFDAEIKAATALIEAHKRQGRKDALEEKARALCAAEVLVVKEAQLKRLEAARQEESRRMEAAKADFQRCSVEVERLTSAWKLDDALETLNRYVGGIVKNKWARKALSLQAGIIRRSRTAAQAAGFRSRMEPSPAEGADGRTDPFTGGLAGYGALRGTPGDLQGAALGKIRLAGVMSIAGESMAVITTGENCSAVVRENDIVPVGQNYCLLIEMISQNGVTATTTYGEKIVLIVK